MRLRTHLLAWLLGPLALLWALALHLQFGRIQAQADAAHDRALLGAAMVMAERVGVQGGRVVADVPPAALAMLEGQLGDRVFWQLACTDPPAWLAGSEDLPAAPALAAQAPQLWDARHNGTVLRMAALARPLFDHDGCRALQLRVGETTAARDALADRLFAEAATVQGALIACAGLGIAWGVRRGLAPLARLRDQVLARAVDDLSPVQTAEVPREVAPLVDAMNAQLARQRGVNEAHRRFVADASHQLKTPLAVLRTQADLALRQPDLPRMHDAVAALRESTEATARMVHQLLALLRSDPTAAHADEALDLVEAVREATFQLLPLALAKRVELGFEGSGAAPLRAHGVLLHELVANLVDNAIRYTPEGGRIAVGAGADGGPWFTVVDSGPGIPAAERERVFARFYRAPGSAGDGCGLGLAIVRQIACRLQARVTLDDAPGGGLAVRVQFPAATSP